MKSPPISTLALLLVMPMFDREDFVWKGLGLHYGRRKTPVLTLAADATYPHLFRIVYPDGWTSTPGI